MSGVVGIWQRDGAPIDRAVFSRMLGRMAHRGPDGSGSWFGPNIALGCQLLKITPESVHETQPLEASSCALVFDGRLDNRAELLHALPHLAADCPDPALVLAAYHSWQDSFVARLNGEFALA